MKMKRFLVLLSVLLALLTTGAQEMMRQQRHIAFATDTLMVHDPVMARERGLYHILSTGHGLQWATSRDRRTWVVQSSPFIERIPQWTYDSVPGFRGHVWAPDIIRWHDRWWLAYSCSTFGRNTSAIGLMSAPSLVGKWTDEGCVVTSKDKRDDWNAIDPAFVIDQDDKPWMAWGSFWDGIQIACLDSTMHLASKPVTIARRYRRGDPHAAENPTSKYAGRNAIEAPYILRHGAWYYLFVSWDYCCRGAKSNYRVAVGRSKRVDGPYVDREGRQMLDGGGTLFLEGDKQRFEAAGHCAAYDIDGETIFVCHAYSAQDDGMSLLLQLPVSWTVDGWPVLLE